MRGTDPLNAWDHARGSLLLDGVRLMGVLNTTPDSFFDGGAWLTSDGRVDIERATERCHTLATEGADILDIGGESTRPGSEPVSEDVEIDRVLPLIRAAAACGYLVSVDTRHAAVAVAAIEGGASIINDVSGLSDPAMAEVVAQSGAGLVVGHLRGVPKTMQREVRFEDLLGEVATELLASVERALRGGVLRSKIVVDPGLGFGKTGEQSAALVSSAGVLRDATGCPVLIGASRKSFVGKLLDEVRSSAALNRAAMPTPVPGESVTPIPTNPPRDAGLVSRVDDRLYGSLAAALLAVEAGASIVRVHDVGPTAEVLGVAARIRVAHRSHARVREDQP